MAIEKTVINKSLVLLLLLYLCPQSSDLLSYSLEAYISEVLVNNQELKLGAYKVKLKKAQEKTKKRETPVSLAVSADNSASSRLSTSTLDSVEIVKNNSNGKR